MIGLIAAALLSGQSLPSAPVPYDSLGGSRPARPAAPATTSVDRPDMPGRGMSGDAWTERVQGRAQAAQARQGPLDGAWILSGPGDRQLYRFQISDTAAHGLEGAWRALDDGSGGRGGSGLFDLSERQGGAAVFQFGRASVSLTPEADGAWSGQLTQGSEAVAVRLTRAEG